MIFTPIDLQTWPRSQMFWYFSQMAPTGWSITVDVDVTGLRTALKAKGYRFFPVYLWLVTKCLNEQIEFKVARKDDIIGYYDTLTPLYASFHEDDKTFSLMWTEFDNDLSVFHRQYCDNQQRYARNHGVLCQPGTPPENAYTVSQRVPGPSGYSYQPGSGAGTGMGTEWRRNSNGKNRWCLLCSHRRKILQAL